MLKTCVVCGRRAATRRCPAHQLPPRGYAHQQARAQTLAEEYLCAECGKPAAPDDPFVAHHVKPRARGGVDHRSNMRAVHVSCHKALAA